MARLRDEHASRVIQFSPSSYPAGVAGAEEGLQGAEMMGLGKAAMETQVLRVETEGSPQC